MSGFLFSVLSRSFRVFEFSGCFLGCFGCFKVLRFVSGFYSVLSQGFLKVLHFFEKCFSWFYFLF